MRRVIGSIVVFVLGFVVSDYYGVPLKQIAAPVYRLLPGLGWLVLLLLFVIVFLLLLMEGARRYHVRIVRDILSITDKAISDYQALSVRIERLTLLEGRYISLYSLLDLRSHPGNSGSPLLAYEIEYHEANLFNTLSDYYGQEFRDGYFKELGDIPEELALQRVRFERHYASLERHIKSANAQRQATLEDARRKRLACAASANPNDHDALQKVGSMPSSKMD